MREGLRADVNSRLLWKRLLNDTDTALLGIYWSEALPRVGIMKGSLILWQVRVNRLFLRANLRLQSVVADVFQVREGQALGLCKVIAGIQAQMATRNIIDSHDEEN